jgi:L-proline amide hydrolase
MVAEDGYADFRGYRTWYRVVGDRNADAVPLVALHGGPGSTHNYFTPLEQLGAERPVVLYDQIGCGNSDRPQDIDWSVDVFRDELDALREQLGLDSIHLLGTSWGGMLAQEHVLSGAQGIVSLTLSSTLANLSLWNEEQLKLKAALPAAVIEVLDWHEAAGTYDDPEYEDAMQVYMDRHFYSSCAVSTTCAPHRSRPSSSRESAARERSSSSRARTRRCSRRRRDTLRSYETS